MRGSQLRAQRSLPAGSGYNLSQEAMRHLVIPSVCLAAALLAVACERPPAELPAPPAEIVEPVYVEVTEPTAALRPVAAEELPAMVDEGGWGGLLEAVERGREWLRGRPDDTVFTYGPRQVAVGEMRALFDRVVEMLVTDPSPEAFAAQLAYEFDLYRSVGGRGGDMLVTGYYEPVIPGSRRRTRECNVPVYAPPKDMFRIDLSEFSDRFEGVRVAGLLRGNRLVPYPDRRELREGGRLRGREIAWACGKVDLFFIEVQGSGTLRYPDGREQRIGYAGANGRQYRSIGKLLIERGEIEREKVSMQSIRAWLAEHPEAVDEILDYNSSVVFFRKLAGEPVGSLGVPVTPERSIATDHRVFPKGAFAFLESEIPIAAPDGSTLAAGPLRRFVVNQDTGGAIRGTDRVDYFWGRGAMAAERAGLMKQPGNLYFVVPKAR